MNDNKSQHLTSEESQRKMLQSFLELSRDFFIKGNEEKIKQCIELIQTNPFYKRDFIDMVSANYGTDKFKETVLWEQFNAITDPVHGDAEKLAEVLIERVQEEYAPDGQSLQDKVEAKIVPFKKRLKPAFKALGYAASLILIFFLGLFVSPYVFDKGEAALQPPPIVKEIYEIQEIANISDSQMVEWLNSMVEIANIYDPDLYEIQYGRYSIADIIIFEERYIKAGESYDDHIAPALMEIQPLYNEEYVVPSLYDIIYRLGYINRSLDRLESGLIRNDEEGVAVKTYTLREKDVYSFNKELEQLKQHITHYRTLYPNMYTEEETKATLEILENLLKRINQ